VAPIAGFAWIAFEHVEPLVFVRIIRHITGLQTPAGGGDEKLTQGVMADDAHDGVGATFLFHALGEDGRDARRVEKRVRRALAMDESPARREGFFIQVLSVCTFRQAVVGVFPCRVGRFMTLLASGGSRILRVDLVARRYDRAGIWRDGGLLRSCRFSHASPQWRCQIDRRSRSDDEDGYQKCFFQKNDGARHLQ
jgi:hypothetical protein